ncbi:MAG: GGDEF domain-containing protein [Betaproteobacteria bacterium]
MTPIELARQTLMQLSKSQRPPTPENFRRVYDEIAGIESADHSNMLNKSLEKVLNEMGNHRQKYLTTAQKISISVKNQDSTGLEEQLRSLLSTETAEENGLNWATLLRYILKQLDANHRGLTLSSKKETLHRVIINFSNDHVQLGQKIQALITSWGDGHPAIQTADFAQLDVTHGPQELPALEVGSQQIQTATNVDASQIKIAAAWRDMLIRTINLVVPQLTDIPDAAISVDMLIKLALESQTIEEVNALSASLKSILLRAEMQNDSQLRILEALLQLLRLLVSSMGELTIEDQWLHGQITIIQEIISKPLNIEAIHNAESSLKELIFKQANIKPKLIEAKDTLKNMVSAFVNRLAEITESTGTYQVKIKHYQEQITATEDARQLNAILESLVTDIGAMNTSAQQSHRTFQATQQKIQDAEKKINELTVKLDHINEVAHEDFLTGTLNRRGMDDALAREFDRADRHNTPLSLAMIDIDHFKKINDTMGHSAGDVALAHLAKVVKSILRSTDILARYGGEEFVILLPGSKQADAVNVMTGVQRHLTKNFFLHNNERVLITFSAGVAERMSGEHVDAVLPRADAALYVAKKTGRNRVVGAHIITEDS